MTMIEMLVATAVFTTLMAMCVTTVVSVLGTQSTAADREDRNAKLRTATLTIERYVRSAEVLYDPAVEPSPGNSLRVYSKVDGVGRCLQWRVTAAPGRVLQTRSWAPAGTPTAWRTMVSGVTNSTSELPFVSGGATYGSKLVSIQLRMASGKSAADAELPTSVGARNTGTGVSATICDPAPAE